MCWIILYQSDAVVPNKLAGECTYVWFSIVQCEFIETDQNKLNDFEIKVVKYSDCWAVMPSRRNWWRNEISKENPFILIKLLLNWSNYQIRTFKKTFYFWDI